MGVMMFIFCLNSTTGAIFLPCRGGGTDTTYYTDGFDVDEDSRTIIDYGGHWDTANWTGVACRHMYDIHTLTSGVVASRLIYLS